MAAPETAMRAHVLRKYGKTNAAIAFEERPEPALKSEEVRIAVEAAALNPVDLKTREGEPKMLLPFEPPFVLGSDLAGKVVELGSGVTSLRVGDSVYAYAGMDRMGAFAEHVVLPAAHVARRPEALSAEEAACLPLPGICALAALDAGKVGTGSRVLVHGGVGGVGAIAVQLAARRPELVRTLTLVSPALPRIGIRRTNVHLPVIATPGLGTTLLYGEHWKTLDQGRAIAQARARRSAGALRS